MSWTASIPVAIDINIDTLSIVVNVIKTYPAAAAAGCE